MLRLLRFSPFNGTASKSPLFCVEISEISPNILQITAMGKQLLGKLVPALSFSVLLAAVEAQPLTRLPPPQNGGECLRAYVSVSLEQIAQWRDEQGNSGLWYVMQVVNQLLDPRTSEFTAAFVGRLVSTLISRAGTELGEQLDQILRAILSKMQQAETLSVMQVWRPPPPPPAAAEAEEMNRNVST